MTELSVWKEVEKSHHGNIQARQSPKNTCEFCEKYNYGGALGGLACYLNSITFDNRAESNLSSYYIPRVQRMLYCG